MKKLLILILLFVSCSNQEDLCKCQDFIKGQDNNNPDIYIADCDNEAVLIYDEDGELIGITRCY